VTFRAEDGIIIGIAVAAGVVRALGALGGTWFNDDWTLLYTVSRNFTVGTPFIVYAGQLHPLLWVFMRGLSIVAPGSYTAAVAVEACLSTAATLLLYALLRRLFGPRPLVVVIVAWFALTTLTLFMSIWPSQAFVFLPFEIAFIASILLLIRYLEQPSTTRMLAVASAVVVGLLSFEKTIVVPVVLFALAAWFPIVSSRPPGARSTLRDHGRLWALLAGLVLAYGGLHFALVAVGHATPYQASGFGFGVGDVVELVEKQVVLTFSTSLLGGPWHWTSGYPEASAAPPTVPVVVTVVVLCALIVATWSRRTARRGWLLLGAGVVFDVALLAYGRLGQWGSDIGRLHHYSADLAVLAALAFAFALMPTRAERSVAEPRPSASRFLAAGLSAALVASIGVSYAGAFDEWATNAAKPYAARARGGFGRVSDVGMLDQQVPPEVLPSLFAPFNTTRVVLSMFPGHPPFRRSVERLFAVDERGFIRRALIEGWQSAPGPVPACGWLVSAPQSSIPLGGSAYPWTWYLGIAYTASRPFTASVSLDGNPVRVRFRAGSHHSYLRAVGSGSSVTIENVPADVRLCVDHANLGSLAFGRAQQ
jgi:hypothetical protein